MKRREFLPLLALLPLALTACASGGVSSAAAPSAAASSAAESTAAPDASSAGQDAAAQPETAVVYFSATGSTKAIAERLAALTGYDLYEITPAEPYTQADLNYSDDTCRANCEQDEPSTRPAIANDLSALAGYDRIFLGYPIWWGTLPRIVLTLTDAVDLSGAGLYTFCTSASSGIEKSIAELRDTCPDLTVCGGERLNDATDEQLLAFPG